MMKNLLTIFLTSLVFFHTAAQTGPAGVGSESNNIVWLDASRLGLSDGSSVSSWTDVSGNNNHAIQLTGSSQPVFRTNQVNTNLPVIEFDGSNDYLDFTSNITTQAASVFLIFNQNNPQNWHGVVSLENHLALARSFNTYNVDYGSGTAGSNKINKSSGYSIFSLATDGSVGPTSVTLTSGSNITSITRTGFHGGPGTSSIGRRALGNAYHMDATIPEVIIYNTKLDSASRNIILAYLGAKYNLNNPNSTIYSYKSTHSNNVMGIGQESDGSNVSARGTDSILISTPSSLDNGDYLVIGNDGGNFSTSASVPSGIVERWNRVWRADVTGTPGTISVEFFLTDGDFSASDNYVVIVESSDGDFSNGGTTIHDAGRSYNPGNNSITFTGLSLSDGDYFTLAEQEAGITAVNDGTWDTEATWSCTCIPGPGDIVTIGNTFDVTIDDAASVLDLMISSGGSLEFTTTDTLTINGIFSHNGTFTPGNGTVAALGMSSQTFTNGSGSTLNLNNFYVNNSAGVDINSGDWSLSGSLQVSGGNLDVSSATSFTLASDASSSSQILASVDNAFTGDFTIQRHIAARNANYANMGMPIYNGTPADLDDDLFISGIGGDDGDATTSGGGTFYSMLTYNNGFKKHDTISSTATVISPGNGFEIWLATDISSFSATTVDMVGSPVVGDFGSANSSIFVRGGWNLIANPYHAFIAWDSIDKPVFITDEYYIFNTANGSYDFFDGAGKPLIAPCQGLWMFRTGVGSTAINFKEEDKVSSSSSTFLRQANKKRNLTLSISSKMNPFKHLMEVQFTPFANNRFEESDAPLLPSPIQEAPAIYSMATNSNEKLIRNTLNSFIPSQLIPISIYTGVEGEYTITASNIETLYANYSCVYLKDNVIDKAIDLSVENEYTFKTNTGDTDRFNLIVSNSFDECEKLISEGAFTQKLDHQVSLRNANGQWYIDYTLGEDLSNLEVRVFNIAGQEVRSPLIFSASHSGNQLINKLDELDGIYLIQVKSKNGIINKTVKL